MIQPTGEVKRVADALLGRILSHEYPAGLRLPTETALAEEFDCGRSTIREALRHMGTMGLVQSRQGSGVTVLDYQRKGTPALLPHYLELGRFDVSPAIMAQEMLRLRTIMAIEAVRLASRYAGGTGLEHAEQLIEKASSLEDDPAAHARNELEVYRQFVIASGMWPAAWMVNALFSPLEEINNRLTPLLPPVHKGCQRAMRKTLSAIRAGNEDEAIAQVESWFTEVDAKVVAQIEQALMTTGSTSSIEGTA